MLPTHTSYGIKDWHKYTCIESCAAIGNARHGCESLRIDIQSIREIDDSGSTLVSEIGNMMTNITGSSILKSTGHTSQVKPGKLSVRFILSDREPCSADPSSRFERTFDSEQSEVVSADESEIGIVSESEDDWYSCESSDNEDEYFYDVVSLVNSHDASLNSLPNQVTETPCETNLDGLALGCRQPSKSDQVTDLSEKAYLHEVIQVPELNETHLCEGQLKNKDSVSQLRLLSNMMEEETHVDSTSSGEQADICQTLFDIVQDQSDVHRRAVKETAISGHPQSDQLRSGKPVGEPGTHITTNIPDRQSQMVEGNLSVNSPNFFARNPLHNVYCCTKCKPMDESGIWSIPTDTLQYVKAEVDSSVTYLTKRGFKTQSQDTLMRSQMTFQTKTHQLTKTLMQRKKTLMLQIIMYLMYQYIQNSCSQTLWKIDMEICLCSQHHTSNLMRVYVQLISGQRIIIVPKWKVRLMT